MDFLRYYAFAFFIFVLVCVVLVLCKLLFSGSRRENKLLDDKETQLLKLFRDLEDIMSDFYDRVDESKAEMQKLDQARQPLLDALALSEAALAQEPERRNPKSAASAPDFKQLVDTYAGDASAPPYPQNSPNAGNKPPNAQNAALPKKDRILQLHSEGKTGNQIAETLDITQSEVSMVIEMNKQIKITEN
jgi:hypothetical protein